MIRRFSSAALGVQFVVDLLLTLTAIKAAEEFRLHVTTGWERRGEVFATVQWEVYVLVFVIWPVFFLLFGVFEPQRRRSLAGDLGTVWLAVTVSMLSLASLFYLLAYDPRTAPSRLFFGYFYVIDLVVLAAAHAAVDRWVFLSRRRGRNIRRVLILGGGALGRQIVVRLRGLEHHGLRLIGFVSDGDDMSLANLPHLGDESSLLRIVEEQRIDEVVMALPAAKHASALAHAAHLRDVDVVVRILPDVFELVAMKARVDDLFGLPLVSISEPSMGPIQARIKRLFDVCIAALLLLVASPFLLAIALWIRLDSPGPIIIHQTRVGSRGEPFHMHKFRSMYWKPEDLDTPVLKTRDDPRVTRIGHWIRRTSLDELPQLWNVLVGEMSLVGPRPELPGIVESYEPWQRKRFNVPPGMTGWWQVNGRSEKSMHANTEIDLYYVQNYSIMLDLQILARTVGAVIRGRGAF